MQRRNIIKSRNVLGKYNDEWYFIIPYGLGTIYFWRKGSKKGYQKEFTIAFIKDELGTWCDRQIN